MTQQEVERLLEEITKRKGPEAPFSLLSNSSSIQRLLILPCIGGMLCRCDCKIVSAGEIFLGAHVDVIVLGVVQDTFQTLVGRNSDRTRRESCILIGIIR